MNQVYIILGYGIPKDMAKDGNYQCYLRGVFNAIYDDVVTNKITSPVIIFSGGKTDVFKPYRRTEAAEMFKAFKILMAKPIIRAATRNWKLVLEPRSISTLENLTHARGILHSLKLHAGRVVIFCEQIHANRVKRLAAKTMAKEYTLLIKAIDFDTSANRYLDPKFLHKKEVMDWRFAIWALRSEENMRKHHQLFQDKLAYLRRAGSARHVEAVKEWWELQIKKVITEK